MKPLVESINDLTMLLKGDVRATLPLEVRTILPKSGLTSWEKFFEAVETLDSESINDELERSERFRHGGVPAINMEIDGFDPDRTGAELMAHIATFKALMPTTTEQLMSYRHPGPSAPPRSTYTYGAPAAHSPAQRPLGPKTRHP
jgi:hypothetical protein